MSLGSTHTHTHSLGTGFLRRLVGYESIRVGRDESERIYTIVLISWIICIMLAIVLILTQTVIFSKKILVLVITF